MFATKPKATLQIAVLENNYNNFAPTCLKVVPLIIGVEPQKNGMKKKLNCKYNLQLASLVLLLTTIISCGGESFDKNQAGLSYRFISHNTDKAKPQIGDVMDLSVKYYLSDSLSLDNRFYLSLDTARHAGGSVETGLAMLHIGDSAVFQLEAMPFFQYSLRQTFPENLDRNSKLRFEVKLHGFKTKKEIKREREAVFSRNKMAEEKEIQLYAKEYNMGTETNSGLYVKQLKSGRGKKITPGKKTTVHYTGSFLTGQVFDSSRQRNTPFAFAYGTGEVITAWEMALNGARVGDKIKMIAPSWYAYHNVGVEGVIPPNTPLLFEIEILETE